DVGGARLVLRAPPPRPQRRRPLRADRVHGAGPPGHGAGRAVDGVAVPAVHDAGRHRPPRQRGADARALRRRARRAGALALGAPLRLAEPAGLHERVPERVRLGAGGDDARRAVEPPELPPPPRRDRLGDRPAPGRARAAGDGRRRGVPRHLQAERAPGGGVDLREVGHAARGAGVLVAAERVPPHPRQRHGGAGVPGLPRDEPRAQGVRRADGRGAGAAAHRVQRARDPARTRHRHRAGDGGHPRRAHGAGAGGGGLERHARPRRPHAAVPGAAGDDGRHDGTTIGGAMAGVLTGEGQRVSRAAADVVRAEAAAVPVPPAVRRAPGRREGLTAFLFLSPTLLVFVVFVVFPILFSFYLSFQQWNLFADDHAFVGLANYGAVFSDPEFWQVFWNTTVYTVATVPLNMVLALGVAVLLERRVRGKRLLRAAFFTPVVVSSVAAGVIWRWVFDPNLGLANVALTAVGLPAVDWTANAAAAMAALIIVGVWKTFGINMVLFAAGLSAIPSHYYEAAAIDGDRKSVV